jgi:hypothetical protein
MSQCNMEPKWMVTEDLFRKVKGEVRGSFEGGCEGSGMECKEVGEM